jgi:hypothetical protein
VNPQQPVVAIIGAKECCLAVELVPVTLAPIIPQSSLCLADIAVHRAAQRIADIIGNGTVAACQGMYLEITNIAGTEGKIVTTGFYGTAVSRSTMRCQHVQKLLAR